MTKKSIRVLACLTVAVSLILFIIFWPNSPPIPAEARLRPKYVPLPASTTNVEPQVDSAEYCPPPVEYYLVVDTQPGCWLDLRHDTQRLFLVRADPHVVDERRPPARLHEQWDSVFCMTILTPRGTQSIYPRNIVLLDGLMEATDTLSGQDEVPCWRVTVRQFVQPSCAFIELQEQMRTTPQYTANIDGPE